MSPECWKKVEAIFNAALAFDREERDDFVRRACNNDPELLKQVTSMLANDEDSESFFESGVLSLLESKSKSDPVIDENINRQIGVYRLVKQVGRGGMGAVYLAERADGEFRQQTAIKLIKRGMDTEQVLKRFLHERQILADLNHPHIARLFDGGTTTDGLPYFVMEYIEGQSILEYCNQNKLSVKQRLRLFLQVCDAVRFAHQKTIVHRDIKPGNVLVTADGNAKLLDFGIAKILGGETGDAFENTSSTLRLLTPDYASPEHAQGLPVTQASDIYSLGILLYELLTDRHPYRFHLGQSVEIEEVIKNSNPEKPSQVIFATKPAQLEGGGKDKLSPETISANRAAPLSALCEELKGNLDTIALKAINKNPSLRHQSADELIKEIEQHLEGKNVSSDLSDSSSLIKNQKKEPAIFSSEDEVNQKKKLAMSGGKSISPRQKGIRQGVILMMLGVVGTPLVAFISLEFKLKPTWMLIFAVLTILGGIMRLAYALIYEESSSQNGLNDGVQNSTRPVEEKESRLLNNHFVSPGSWIDDFIHSAGEDSHAQFPKKADQNKNP